MRERAADWPPGVSAGGGHGFATEWSGGSVINLGGLPGSTESYATSINDEIAEGAGCARSTRAEAIKALEDAGLLTWAQRIKRVREAWPDLGDSGWRWRVLRTSNSYAFANPSPAADRPNSSKSEKPTGTPNQDFFSPMRTCGCESLKGRDWRTPAPSAPMSGVQGLGRAGTSL